MSFPLLHGKQTDLQLIDPDGSPVSLSKLMEWEWKRDSKQVESIGLDGKRDVLNVYHGVSGSFTAELEDMDLFQFEDDRAAEYEDTGISRYSSAFVYFTMLDGSEVAYHLTDLVLMIEDRGTAKADETIKIKCKFMAAAARPA